MSTNQLYLLEKKLVYFSFQGFHRKFLELLTNPSFSCLILNVKLASWNILYYMFN